MDAQQFGEKVRSGLPKVLVVGLLVFGVGFSVKRYAPGLFDSVKGVLGHRDVAESVVPQKVELPAAPAEAGAAPKELVISGEFPVLSSYDLAPGCPDLPEVRLEGYAWNGQINLLGATGGPQATKGSLMCKHGVNMKFERQDMNDQMQSDLVACATELASGKDTCDGGKHFVTIMGDGAAAFLAGLNPQLAKIGAAYEAEVVGSFGYSTGEDAFMGPPAWRANPEAARGAFIAGVLRDGDWNIAMKWAADNGICNNPDERTYDPNCLNWVNAPDYVDAAQKYVSSYPEDRPVKGSSETRHLVVNGIVTWTPGDVVAAHAKGGLVKIVSTRQYYYQMPNTIIGIKKWDATHRSLVLGMLSAAFEETARLKADDGELRRAAAVSALLYHDKDEAAKAEYWYKYFKGTVERDKTGLQVELGGSRVNSLADNCFLYGLQDCAPGSANLFAATYTAFGNIVVAQYPNLVPSYPPVAKILNTSFIEELARTSATPVAAAEVPTFEASRPVTVTISKRLVSIEFNSGSTTFRPDAYRVLADVEQQALVAGTLAIEIHGHTDSMGNPSANRILSQERALAVKQWLQNRSPANFSDARVRSFGHGDENPIASNTTVEGRAKNRRVEIVLGTTN